MNLVYSVFHIGLIFGLSFLLWKRQDRLMKQIFWPALASKLIAGLCLGALYQWYYATGDTFVYFADASQLAALGRRDFPAYLEALFLNSHLESVALSLAVPRALFLSKIASVFNLLSGDQYWLTGFYFSFISFVGAWHLVRTVVAHIRRVRAAAVIAFLFLPSVVFWTSGLLKESLAMAALFFLTALFLKAWFGERPHAWEYVLAGVSFLVLWNLKYYYVAVFVPVCVASLCYKLLLRRRFQTKRTMAVLVWLALFAIPAIAITFLHPNFNIDRIAAVMVSNNALYNSLSAPEDVVHFHALEASPIAIALNAPVALFSGLFRPLPWEARGLTAQMAAVENALLLILFVAALCRFRAAWSSPHRLLVFSVVVYVVVLCVFLTISAPNFGTLSRYRVGYLACFVFVILCDNPLLQSAQRSFSRLVSH